MYSFLVRNKYNLSIVFLQHSGKLQSFWCCLVLLLHFHNILGRFSMFVKHRHNKTVSLHYYNVIRMLLQEMRTMFGNNVRHRCSKVAAINPESTINWFRQHVLQKCITSRKTILGLRSALVGLGMVMDIFFCDNITPAIAWQLTFCCFLIN